MGVKSPKIEKGIKEVYEKRDGMAESVNGLNINFDFYITRRNDINVKMENVNKIRDLMKDGLCRDKVKDKSQRSYI